MRQLPCGKRALRRKPARKRQLLTSRGAGDGGRSHGAVAHVSRAGTGAERGRGSGGDGDSTIAAPSGRVDADQSLCVTGSREAQAGTPVARDVISFARMSPTIERLRIAIADVTYALAPLEHLEDVKAGITAAVLAGAGFVDLNLDNGGRLSVLITASSTVTIFVETLQLDSGTADGEDNPERDAAAFVDYDPDIPFDII